MDDKDLEAEAEALAVRLLEEAERNRPEVIGPEAVPEAVPDAAHPIGATA